MSSSVKADWNCSFNTLAFAKSDDAGKPKLVMRVGMPVYSLRLIYMTKRIKDHHSGLQQLFQIYKHQRNLAQRTCSRM